MSSEPNFWITSYPNQYFIYNDLSPENTSYGMNVSGYGTSEGTPIVAWPWQGGLQNELWTYNENGQILPGSAGSMVIGLGGALQGEQGYNVVLVPQNGEDVSQQWFLQDGHLINKNNQWVLALASSEISATPALVCVPEGSSYAYGYHWTMIPATDTGPLPDWKYIQTQLPEANDNFGINISEDQEAYFTPLILWPWQGGQANELWAPQEDGMILSKLMHESIGPNYVFTPLALTFTGPNSPVSPNTVFTGPGTLSAFNQWIITEIPSQKHPHDLPQVTIATNEETPMLLTVQSSSPSQGDPVVLAAQPADGPAPGQLWKMFPTNQINTLLQLPPLSFPKLKPGMVKAYAYINKQLGISSGTIRSQYANLAEDLTGWSVLIGAMKKAPDTTEKDWKELVDQLQLELVHASVVRNFFSNWATLEANIFQIDSQNLANIIEWAGLSDESMIECMWSSIIQGLIYTVATITLNEELAIFQNMVANLLNTGLSAANACPTGPELDTNYSVEAVDLGNKLAESFSSLNTWIQSCIWIFLADWRKMQKIVHLIGAGGIDSLAWQPSLNLYPAAFPGYNQVVLQMLLPSKWQIFWNPGQSCQWLPASNQFPLMYEGINTTAFMAEIGDSGTTPDPAMMSFIFGTGPDSQMMGIVNPNDFFFGINGWNFTVTIFSN